ncbi:MAG: Glucosyl-3-phosphoglycerate/mannosyl-3-phosphoglycerate phosphatase [Syntrophorhabdus sp. PtaU1.Bin002]|nr:MAG: Glucosyl-3-phosphoglycerate/mannosyl-3-phosphoglycerate phosphatase [Syntrophorhabdus sp. PtaU1.Bin002]
MTKPVIFSDLDGTLLDERYSFRAAEGALALIEERGIPLVICSSKTRAEIELYRRKLNNQHPFIAENGGGVFVPRGYFAADTVPSEFTLVADADYQVIRLGTEYAQLRRAMEELRGEGFEVKGFGDMSAEVVSQLTGLSPEEATASKERDFDEPFLFQGDRAQLPLLYRAIRKKGFRYTEGRFFHILGESDKGKAVTLLSALYRAKHGEIVTIGIGDSPNDIPMLKSVNYPIIVKHPDGTFDPRIHLGWVIKADGVGPEGWNKAILQLIKGLAP